ncbi:MAG: hypothetical protein IT176_03250 [Acidobacteria bacterium]|nr:hypothetical protein [Acidobacteriota bacterium]
MVPGRTYSPTLILRMLWRQKWRFLLGAGLGAAVAAAYVLRQPVLFRAEATLLVQPALVPQNYARPTVSQDLDTLTRTLSEQVFARERLIGLFTDLAARLSSSGVTVEELADQARSGAGINLVREDAFRLTMVNRDPVRAAQLASVLAAAFVAQNLESRAGLADEADQFVEAQVESTRQRLAENEKRLEEYRRTYSGELPTQLSANLQVMQNAQVQLQALTEAIEQDRERKARLDERIATLTAQAPPAPVPVDTASPKETEQDLDLLAIDASQIGRDQAPRQLEAARSMLARLRLRLKPDHPDIVRLQRLIAELERRGDAAPEDATDPQPAAAARAKALAQLQAESRTVEERLAERAQEDKRLRETIADYQHRIELTPTRETELTTLMRDYDTLRDSYRSLLAKKEEARIGAELERRRVGESLKVVAAPRVPDRPFSPATLSTVLAGTGVGLAAVFLVAAWREYQDTALRTEQEIAATLDVPVLAFIPVMRNWDDTHRVRVRTTAALGAAAVLIAAAAAYLLLVRGI